MNDSFPRRITLLRKERGLSQKSAAASLGVSQALLSHYEKGVRECSLDFVVKTADFYQVSADYLLGRSSNRTGATISLEELPEQDAGAPDAARQSSMLPILNKKLLGNSLHVIFSLLQECNNRQLTSELSTYLSVSIYKSFRLLYSANGKNPKGLFAVPQKQYAGFADALRSIAETNAQHLAAGSKIPALSPEALSHQYPVFSTALFHLIQSTEEQILHLLHRPEE